MASIKKNIGNLALAALIVAAIGCTCPNFTKLTNGGNSSIPSPTPSPLSVPMPTKKGEYEISLIKFKQIKVGTSRVAVETLLGGEGTELSSSETGKVKLSTNKWTGEGYTSIILVFKNDKVLSKSQVGLK